MGRMSTYEKCCALYALVFGEDFRYEDYEHRLKIRSILYLLKEMGIEMSYTFFWHRKAPECAELIIDALAAQIELAKGMHKETPQVELSAFAEDVVSKLQKLVCDIPIQAENQTHWVCTLALAHYMQSRECGYFAALDGMKLKCDWFSNEKLNELAYNEIKKLKGEAQ